MVIITAFRIDLTAGCSLVESQLSFCEGTSRSSQVIQHIIIHRPEVNNPEANNPEANNPEANNPEQPISRMTKE
jgi:hypothetical protein